MTKQERNTFIESYGNAYNILVEALKEFPKEMWQWKPAPEKWSIHEVIFILLIAKQIRLYDAEDL